MAKHPWTGKPREQFYKEMEKVWADSVSARLLRQDMILKEVQASHTEIKKHRSKKH